MDKSSFEILDHIIGKTYSNIGEELLNTQKKEINNLLNQRSCPEEGWDELTINLFFNYLASMDSNNGLNHIGIGEREGRIFSKIVKNRNFGLVHGIGRSGEVTELQPKAVGSSLLVQLAHSVLQNFLHSIGYSFIKDLLILPFATGMSLTLTMLTLKQNRSNGKYVIFPRIDQKTCFKCIITSNLIPIVVEPFIVKDELQTNLELINEHIKTLGGENILCILSTTSCFSPRAYDKVKEISKICKDNDIPHVINNAYGIYCTKVTDMLNQSIKAGRIDAIISSTDKNFMVPVGGSIIYSPNESIIKSIKKNYPGRASISPIIDLFITLLEMGKKRYKEMIKDRKLKFLKLKEIMQSIASKYNERILEIPNNKISLSMTLNNICKDLNDKKDVTFLGSLFYSRQISGIRIIASGGTTKLHDKTFSNYGSNCEKYPCLPYATFAAAIGITDTEVINKVIQITEFAKKFSEIIEIFVKKNMSDVNKSIFITTETNTSSKGKKSVDKGKEEKLFVINENSFSI